MRSRSSIIPLASIPAPFTTSLSRMLLSPSSRVLEVTPYLLETNASM